MIQRTRRDLTDPRVKKIVKAQTEKKQRQLKHRRQQFNGSSSSYKLIVTLLLILIGGGAIYSYANWPELNSLLDLSILKKSSISRTENHKSDQPAALPPKEEKKANTVESNPEPEVDAVKESSSPDNALKPVARRIQVEVLNGCGKDGLAEQATLFLREQDIDVVSRGNYENFNVAQTTILDRIENPERVEKIADILGVTLSQVQTRKDKNLQLDATIILGADYKTLKPFKN